MPRLDRQVRTSDGVALRYAAQGAGPPLVLVHGGATDHRCFEPVRPMLSEFTLVPYDRRGHGESGGTAAPSLSREAADLRELLEHVAPDGAFVLGYSFGALVVLHALAETVPVRAAVLYEPPLDEPEMLPAAAQVLDLLERGLRDEALEVFVATTFHLSGNVVAAMRRGPMWDVSVGLVDNLRRELPLVATATVPAPPLATQPPTRVLTAQVGGNPAFHGVARRIQAVLPVCDVVRVPGLPHFAMATEPAEFARVTKEHFARQRGTGPTA